MPKAQLADASQIDWRRPYREALVNEWLPTRLGDGTITVAVKNLVSPFTGQKIDALPIPGRWLRGVVLPDGPINVANGQLRIGSQDYAYNGLELSGRYFSSIEAGGVRRKASHRGFLQAG